VLLVACVLAAALAPLAGPDAGVILSNVVVVLAPLTASAACLGARGAADPGARTTWLLVAGGAVLAAVGHALSARADFSGAYIEFPSIQFYLLTLFHLALAEGAILALRPARDPRLALEVALDGVILLLAASALVLRFFLETPLTEGWLPLSQAAAVLLGQFSVAASLLFVGLLVFWRDAELSGPVVDGLLVSTVLLAFGHYLVTLGFEPLPGFSRQGPDLIRLGGWFALTLTAGLGMLRPRPGAAARSRAAAARTFRQLIIPGVAVFLTAWALDAAGAGVVPRLSRVVVGAMGVLLAVRVGTAVRAVERESRERTRAEQRVARARMRAVTAQMNPHFLFNALHSLSALVRRDPRESEAALERLGSLLRYGVDSGEDLVPLRAEWRFASDYLELERMRLGDRLRVEKDSDEEALERLVPPFILQPLVENAVRYAVSPFPDGGTVRMQAYLQGDRMQVEVRDSGPGATSGATEGGTGVGLRGVRAQLQTHFQDDWSMETLVPETGGFLVRLEFPAEAE
jgi:hypothetical protein